MPSYRDQEFRSTFCSESSSHLGFFSFSADAGREAGGDGARLFAPREVFIFPPFLSLTVFALSVLVICDTFFEFAFVVGGGGTGSAGISWEISSSSSKISVLRSCPLNATLQNEVLAFQEKTRKSQN